MEQKKTIIPAAAIIPTMNRPTILVRTINSLLSQDCIPQSIVIVDASPDNRSEIGVREIKLPDGVGITYARAVVKGAAHQRTQAVSLTSLPYVVFMDDDILFEPHCMQRIVDGFAQGTNIGGVNAMITNQRYEKPGRFTRFMFRLLDGPRSTWAGRVIGPAWNQLPEDDPELPEYVPCDWMNLGCTMYRRDALPDPLFPDSFYGYSSFEDLTLSSTVAKNWKLLNARTARIFHDTQPGDYKNNLVRLCEMEVVNRHYVMTEVLGRNKIKDYAELFLFELFKLTALLTSPSKIRMLPRITYGRLRGYFKIMFS